MSLAKIPNRTDYVDEVYKSLLDAISAGVLAPGERITQEDLAEKLNVSRSPVLQALRLLKKMACLKRRLAVVWWLHNWTPIGSGTCIKSGALWML